MTGKLQENERELFRTRLTDLINPNYKLALLAGGKKGKKIILAIKGFISNPYDGHTIEPLLNQMKNNNLALPK